MVQDQLARATDRMDLVPREEFEVVRDMAERARQENVDLTKRIAALEKQLAALTNKA